MKSFEKYEKVAEQLAHDILQELPEGSFVDKDMLISFLHKNSDGSLSEDDVKELVSPAMIEKIKEGKYFTARNEMYEEVDVNKEWVKFNHAIQNRQSSPGVFKQVLQYAAVLLIPLMCAGLGYYLVQTSSFLKDPVANVIEIQPGGPKAQLILANGSKVDLDNEKVTALREKDGTRIEKESGTLKYQEQEQDNKKDYSIYNTVEIPKGGEYQLQLADGTKVHLNSMSSLKFPVRFTGKRREVELTGEAYFEVTKDAQHPFVVNMNGMQIEVLGTSFNVKAYESDSEMVTTLVEGKVKVKAINGRSEQVILHPNQQAQLNHQNGNIEVDEVDVSLYTAWKNGKFLFRDERLEDIMKELSRWYDIKVFYMNQSVKELQFSGNLNKYKDISSMLEMIQVTESVTVEVKGNIIVFSEK